MDVMSDERAYTEDLTKRKSRQWHERVAGTENGNKIICCIFPNEFDHSKGAGKKMVYLSRHHHFALKSFLRLTSLRKLILVPRIREKGLIQAHINSVPGMADKGSMVDGRGHNKGVVGNIGHVLYI